MLRLRALQAGKLSGFRPEVLADPQYAADDLRDDAEAREGERSASTEGAGRKIPATPGKFPLVLAVICAYLAGHATLSRQTHRRNVAVQSGETAEEAERAEPHEQWQARV